MFNQNIVKTGAFGIMALSLCFSATAGGPQQPRQTKSQPATAQTTTTTTKIRTTTTSPATSAATTTATQGRTTRPSTGGFDFGRAGDAQVGHSLFLRAIERLGDDDVPVQFHLTGKQQALVDKVRQDYRRAMRVYQQAHHEEFSAARNVLTRAARQQATLNTASSSTQSGTPVTAEQVADAKETLRDLRAKGPQASAYHFRLWASLSEEQQTFVRGELQDFATRAANVQPVSRTARATAATQSGDANNLIDWEQLGAAVSALPQQDQQRVMRRISEILRGRQVSNSSEWNQWRQARATFKVNTARTTEVADVPDQD